ncbi:MAG TPA: lamin tail domain-containing protein, partial [Methanothrix sp.]|nr:lamin tail domain-containing protein [Methanothrix sp.]
ALNCILYPLASGSIVINEMELDDLADSLELQWIELYNSGNDDVDISGWAVMPNDDRSKKEVVFEGAVIPPKGFFVIGFLDEWANKYGTVVVLVDDEDREVERTPNLYDSQQDVCAWGRYPDGSSEWLFMISTPGEPNSGDPCEEEAVLATILKVDGSARGKGFVNIRNRATGSNGDKLLSQEHGSGDYESECSIDYYYNDNNNVGSVDLEKENTTMRYDSTEKTLPNNRTARYSSKWTESSEIKNIEAATKIAQSTRYASSISKDLDMRSVNSDLQLNISSDFDGKSNINCISNYFKSGEEYVGSFDIEEQISEDIFNRSASSTKGPGFVAVYKKFGEGMSSYERGSGSYRVEEQIDPDSDFMTRDIWLNHSPAGYDYLPGLSVNRSAKWNEGFAFNRSDAFFMSEAFSNLDRLEKHMEITSSDEVKTLASFVGHARLRSAFRPDPLDGNSSERAIIDDEYEGSFSIEKKITILPRYDKPHLSLSKYGYVDLEDCNILRFSINLENDGNRTLGPIYLRDTFPSGTHLTAFSLPPFELTRSYGNWSIPALGSGESISINLAFEVSTQRQNYTNRVRAVTAYPAVVKGVIVERRIRASNSTTVEADWNVCPVQKLSADLTATVSPKDDKIVSYRLTLNNSAGYNISANVTALLPQGMRFINSTTKPLGEEGGEVKWMIKKLDAGKKRTISFMAEAESDGLFLCRAYAVGNSSEGSEGARPLIADASAFVYVGRAPEAARIEYCTECLSCGDDGLSQTLQTAQAGIPKDLTCCA